MLIDIDATKGTTYPATAIGIVTRLYIRDIAKFCLNKLKCSSRYK